MDSMSIFAQDQIEKLNRQIGDLARDFAGRTVDLYNGIKAQPVCGSDDETRRRTLAALQDMIVPSGGRPVSEVYTEMLNDVYSDSPLPQHPRSFACVPSTASLLSWLGDIMTGAFNPHASCRFNAPAADIIENKLLRWMGDLAGYPESSGGIFVSGGSIANLTALTAARDTMLSVPERSRAVVYVSDQTHSSVAKGLLIIGFAREQIRVIPSDKNYCLDTIALRDALAEDLKAGRKPFAVVASAGTTNTGSVDPLKEIAAICRSHNMWMHVDGAYGASALLSEKQRQALAGIELSDSISWDAHKWMLQTYGCSVVLVRDRACLARSFAAHPEYLKDAQSSPDSIEFWDLGPELTRSARALKLWLTLQVLGSRNMGLAVDHGCKMAELAEALIRRQEGFEIVSGAHLGIVNFRYTGAGSLSDREADLINQEIAARVTGSGFAQIFTTELSGRKVLRMCTINPQTTEEDISATVKMLAAAAPARGQHAQGLKAAGSVA